MIRDNIKGYISRIKIKSSHFSSLTILITMNCIEIRNLTHSYSKGNKVIDGIDLSVPEGSIFGFLGKNGAGKTTTLRLLLGLHKKQQGSIEIFGKKIDSDRIEILKNVGSLIESPSFYAHLTAKANLKILQKIHNCPKERIEEVLEIVGLSGVGSKKVSQFSLGMKQRLSIAIALLHSPKLLILDEPTNGLDPNGIIEMRTLLRKLNTEDKITIVISSHLLSEIEKIITHLAVINNGAVVFEGAYEDLKAKQTQKKRVIIETNDVNKAEEITKTFGQEVILKDGASITLSDPDRSTIATLNKKLVESGIEVYQIVVQENDLESIFINLIEEK
ncbi:MAG: ABC-type multidrug transport system ATPase subunit [Crocinitomicaceae bacterium]